MKKTMHILKNIVVGVIAAFAVFMMLFTIISVSTFNRNDRQLFGYRAYIALSDSMSKTDFVAGDLVLVKETDPSTLKEGDIISYISQNTDNYGEVVTHKIRRLTTDANGEPGFVTYGTTTDTDDETVVTYAFVLGKYQKHIPKLGTFFQFLKTTRGYITCIFLPFMLLILYQALNCVKLFRRYKQEQMDEMQQEKAKLEKERAESAKMMEELQALKAQLEQQKMQDTAGNKPEETVNPASEPVADMTGE